MIDIFGSKYFTLPPKMWMLCAIWYDLCNLKNVNNTHGGVLLLVKLQASACNFAKSNTTPGVFVTLFKLY